MPISNLFKSLALAVSLLAPQTALAENDTAGEFDYYVMALSWSPNWCALEGFAKGSPQCEAGQGYGWVLHGLWPQYHRGWPSFCRSTEPHPTRRMSWEMADIMGSPGLAWYQWKKHGSCSGLTARGYYDLSRRAYDSVIRPDIFRRIDRKVTLPAKLVEEAFLKANPTLEPDMLTITCRDGHIQEARVCLSKQLKPVPCGQDTVRDCKAKSAVFTPLR